MNVFSFIDTFDKICEIFAFSQEQIDMFYLKYQEMLTDIVENKVNQQLIFNFFNGMIYYAVINNHVLSDKEIYRLFSFSMDKTENEIPLQSYQYILSNVKKSIDQEIRNSKYITTQSEAILNELIENHKNAIAKYGSFKYKSISARNVESACKQENQLIHDLNLVVDNINTSLRDQK